MWISLFLSYNNHTLRCPSVYEYCFCLFFFAFFFVCSKHNWTDMQCSISATSPRICSHLRYVLNHFFTPPQNAPTKIMLVLSHKVSHHLHSFYSLRLRVWKCCFVVISTKGYLFVAVVSFWNCKQILSSQFLEISKRVSVKKSCCKRTLVDCTQLKFCF